MTRLSATLQKMYQYFNSHAHVERDGKKMNEIIISIISTHTLTWSVTCDEICIQHQNLYFNSHAHVERDVIIVSLPLKYLNFNSHAHVERDASWINKIVAKFDFNSHAHVERDICLAYFSFEKIYFNSHAHVERDFIKKLSDEITKISTHTLTWSVTIVHKLKITVENNFNSHAHVERDSSPIVNAYGVVYFNSHAHVERDALLKFSLCQIIGISTHTLTWSVTIYRQFAQIIHKFQLTRSRGA